MKRYASKFTSRLLSLISAEPMLWKIRRQVYLDQFSGSGFASRFFYYFTFSLIVIVQSSCTTSSQRAKASGSTTQTTLNTPSTSNAAPLPDDSTYQVHSHWTDQNGRSIKLEELRGQAVIISMVYLKCNFSCPMTVANMKSVQEKLSGDLGKKVRFVLVSFDPENDTPEAMAKFAANRKLASPSWLLLSSKSESDIRELSVLLDFRYKKLPNGEFEHSFSLIALDPLGRVIARADGAGAEPQDLVAAIEKSLN